MTGLFKKVVRWFSNPPTETNAEEPCVKLPINALKEWTGKGRATIIYDSMVDEFTADRVFNHVRGKRNIAVVGFTTDGDVFGGFYSVAVTEQGGYFCDPNMFIFSFESHGRCATPQRFMLKKRLKKKASVCFCKTITNGFASFGVYGAGTFWLGDEKSNLYCWNVSDAFDGLENTTLTGKDGFWSSVQYHHCTRIVAVWLE